MSVDNSVDGVDNSAKGAGLLVVLDEAADLEPLEVTEAQLRCWEVPLVVCAQHERCFAERGKPACPGYTVPSRGVRA